MHHQVHLFLEVSGEIAHNAGEPAEHLFDRLHAGLHDGGLEISRNHIQVGYRLVHVVVFTFSTQTLQAVTHQHQLTHHIHDVIEPLGVDTNRRFRGRGILASRHRRCGSAFGLRLLGRLRLFGF